MTTRPARPAAPAWTRETFPADNWTGHQATFEVSPDRLRFRLHGYTFTLEADPVAPLQDGDDPRWIYTAYTIRGSGWAPDYSLGKVGKFADDRDWTASAMDLTRDAADPIVAAAKIIMATV